MNHSKMKRRKPTAAAIIVGVICMLLSLAIVAGIGVLLFIGIEQLNRTAAVIFLWVGTLPWVILWLWLTVTLMDYFEKMTGISLRTKSARAPSTKNDEAA